MIREVEVALYMCQVSQRERELAERYYLKCYAREAQGMSSSGQPSIEQHPRYTELAAGKAKRYLYTNGTILHF